MTTYAVIGSRGFTDYSAVCETMDKLPVSRIVSGGARGADSLGARYAKEHCVPLTEYLPDYAKHGRGAPFVRNRTIIEDSQEVVAFWDGKSRGTAHALEYARKLGKPVHIVSPKEPQ